MKRGFDTGKELILDFAKLIEAEAEKESKV